MMKNNSNPRTRRIVAIALVSLMLVSMSLTSCTAFMKEASVSAQSVDGGMPLPVVSGFMKSDSINRQISDSFGQYSEQLGRVIEETDGRLSVEYEMEQSGDGFFGSEYTITMYLTDGKSSIRIKSVSISGLDTVRTLDEPGSDWITSADVAESVLCLEGMGIDCDTGKLGQYPGERDAVELFVRLYEGIAGKETDVSAVTAAEGDLMLKKAMLLGFVPIYDTTAYYFDDYIQPGRVNDIAAAVLTDVERDVYGRQSETVTGEEFAGYLRTLLGCCQVHDVNGARALWQQLCDMDFDSVIAGMGMISSPFTRRDAAEFVGRITKEGPKFSMLYSDQYLTDVEDGYDSIWVRRAITHGFMDYYGDSTIFAPEEGLTVVNAISSAKAYTGTRYYDWLYHIDYNWDGHYTYSDLYCSARVLAMFFGSRPESDRYNFKVTTVINDRDYNWFFSQHNTGEYSAINCMPSIATMASHWYDQNSTATVKKMRKTSDYDDGWTAWELRNGLDRYKVPYTIEDATIENITAAIDSGKIVLAQYSDRPLDVSGHCYVIYGYRRFGESITFIINDSDSLSYRASIFGRAPGNGDEVEGKFSIWSISRFVSDVTVVG